MAQSSKLSVASILFCVGPAVLSAIALALFFIVAVSFNQGNSEEGQPFVYLFGAVFMLSPIFYLLSIGLGIGALVKKEPRRYLGVIALVLNGFFLIGVLFFIVLAIAGVSV